MVLSNDINHDGGTHNVAIEMDGDQAVISFGASFTLRVDEANLWKLRDLLHDAGRILAIERRDTTDLSGRKFLVSEDDFVQAGIDAREDLKQREPMLWRKIGFVPNSAREKSD